MRGVTPSFFIKAADHAPVVMDLDAPGKDFDPGWSGALERIAARTKPRP